MGWYRRRRSCATVRQRLFFMNSKVVNKAVSTFRGGLTRVLRKEPCSEGDDDEETLAVVRRSAACAALAAGVRRRGPRRAAGRQTQVRRAAPWRPAAVHPGEGGGRAGVPEQRPAGHRLRGGDRPATDAQPPGGEPAERPDLRPGARRLPQELDRRLGDEQLPRPLEYVGALH